MAKADDPTTFKLVLAGDVAVGKTCILQRFCDDSYSNILNATMGCSFERKDIQLDDTRIRLIIWDPSGQERFRTITTSYFRGAQGILLVYDVTNRSTFQAITNWIHIIESNAPADIRIILIGHKCDYDHGEPHYRQVTTEEGEALARVYDIRFYESSAKQNINIEEAFIAIARDVKSQMLVKTPSLKPAVQVSSGGSKSTSNTFYSFFGIKSSEEKAAEKAAVLLAKKQEEEEVATRLKKKKEERQKRQEEETAAALRKKRQEEEAAAALLKKKKEEETAAALRKKRQEEETAAALLRKRQEEEAAAALLRKKKEEETAALLRKKRQEEETAAALLRKRQEEEAAAALLKKKKDDDWLRSVNENREDIEDMKSLLSRIGFSKGESQKCAEVLVINHEVNSEIKFQVALGSNSQHYYAQLQLSAILIQLIERYLTTLPGKLDSPSHASLPLRESSSGSNKTGKAFTFDGITITDAMHMSVAYSDNHNPLFDGMYFGSFNNLRKKYKVVIKESIRLRDITQEASIFAHLQSYDDAKTGCIEMYGFNKGASPPFIVLESFGCDLHEKILSNRRMKLDLKQAILKRLVEALAALHDLGVMHGDIKPQNILVDPNWNVKLCDLDSARVVTTNNNLFPHNVETKELKFSPLWVSPEVYVSNLQKQGGVFKASFAIDVFSVGLIAALLEDRDNAHTNGVVLPRQDIPEYHRALTDETFLHSHVLKVEGAYRDTILRMCHLNPALRPTSLRVLRVLEEEMRLTKAVHAKEQVEKHNHFLEDKVVSKLDSIADMLHQFSDKMTELVTSNKDVEALLHQVGNQVAHISYISEEQSREMTKLQAELQQTNSTLHTLPASTQPVVLEVVLERITALNNKINTILQDTWKIPTLAVVLKKSKNRMFRDDYALYFLCEHTLELVPCGPSGEGFEFKQLKKTYANAFKKMAPLLMVGLTMLKIAVTLYGIPIPLPDLSNLTNADIKRMLNDIILDLDVNEVEASIQAIASSENPLDVIDQAMVTTDQQREAYQSLLQFLDKDEYKPHKFGLVKVTSKSGITKWIKNDRAVITSFEDHGGRQVRLTRL